METEKLIAFIKSQGYTRVYVNLFRSSFQVHCCSLECDIVRNYDFPISELPSTPDGSKRYQQILNDFPSVHGEVKL